MLDVYKEATRRSLNKRPYGERLLRAAAKGEDWTKIKKEEKIHEEYTYDATGSIAAAIDRSVLAIIDKRKSRE